MKSRKSEKDQRIRENEVTEDFVECGKRRHLVSSLSASVLPSVRHTLLTSGTSRDNRTRKCRYVQFHNYGVTDRHARWRVSPIQGVLQLGIFLVTLLGAFWVTMGLSESREPIRLRHVGVKLDKVAALSDGTIWAAGNGQVFLYDENTGRVSRIASQKLQPDTVFLLYERKVNHRKWYQYFSERIA